MVLLENVGNLLCKSMQPLMSFLVEARNGFDSMTVPASTMLSYLPSTIFCDSFFQEFMARGWQLTWNAVTGHNVGIQVEAPATSFLQHV